MERMRLKGGGAPLQGRRHEVLFGGGGRIRGHPNPPNPPPPKKNHFLLGFRPLNFENVGLGLKQIICVKYKVAEILLFLGDVPR